VRRGSVHGLTTAASVWESAAIGMAAGAGLLLLASVMTAMHLLIIVGFMPLARRLASRLGGSVRLHITYADDRGVLRDVLQACGRRDWQITDLETDPPGEPLGAPPGHVGVQLTLGGAGVLRAASVLALIDGVAGIRQLQEDPD